jgi:hypothetical protein
MEVLEDMGSTVTSRGGQKETIGRTLQFKAKTIPRDVSDWKTGRLADWQIGRLADWQTGLLPDWQTGRLGDMLTCKQTDK